MAARKRIASRRKLPPNLYMKTDGYFWYRNPKDGKTFGLGRDERAAVIQVRAMNARQELELSDASLISRVMSGGRTLKQWCVEYETAVIERYRETGNSRRNVRAEIEIIASSILGKLEVSEVQPKHVATLVKEMEKRGGTVAAAVRSRIRDIFRHAIEHGLIAAGTNPADDVMRPKVKVARSRLTLEDFIAVRDKAREDTERPWIANSIDLALLTGQRRSDIAKMQFDDVKDGFLWVKQEKYGAQVKIPLSIRLDAVGMSLDEVIRRCRDDALARHMIHAINKKGRGQVGKPVLITTLSSRFQEMRIASKIKIQEGRTAPSFHEIRSLSARLYTEQYGAEVAQAILGHKTAEMTAVYRDVRGSEWTEVRLKAS